MFKSKVSMFLTILIILFTCTYAYGVNYYSGIPFSDTASDGDVATWGSSGKWEWITPNSGTDITVDLEEETHAADHIPSGADPVEPWLWGGALEIGDATPPIASGYVYDCTDATTITITDFYAVGSDDHTGFVSGKSRFRVWMNDEEVTVDFSANAEIEGNAGQDFTGSASDFVLLEFLYLDTGWQCTNFTSGFSNPTTLAISKAQFDYTIANPQAITIGAGGITAGTDNVTIGTEITSSTVYLTSDSDDDSDTLVLQDAGTGYDGAKLTFVTKAGFDAPGDAVIIDVSAATDCNDVGCPYGGDFTLRGIGATLSLRWDSTTDSWWLENYYQPPVDFYTDTDHQSTIAGIDTFGASTYIEYSASGSHVSMLYRIVGKEAGATTVTFTVPFTSKDRSDAGMIIKSFINARNGSAGLTGSIAKLNDNSTTVTCSADFTGANFEIDNDEDRLVEGQFTYQVE